MIYFINQSKQMHDERIYTHSIMHTYVFMCIYLFVPWYECGLSSAQNGENKNVLRNVISPDFFVHKITCMTNKNDERIGTWKAKVIPHERFIPISPGFYTLFKAPHSF